MVERAGEEAGLGFKAHPHMLRHACGFALASEGHDTRTLQAYLGVIRRAILALTQFWCSSVILRRLAWPEANRSFRVRTFDV
jgi:site-specific recombinase XerD